MPKGRKLLRGKGLLLPATPPEDIFDNDSSEEEEEVADKPQEEQLEESQAATDQVPRPESPVLPDLKRACTEKRKYASLTQDEKVTLCEWYKQNELFYNKRLNAYRDKERKAQLWQEQAEKMGKTVDILVHWMINMRTRYAKLIDNKSAIHTRKSERDQWIQDSFEFLRPHIVRCPAWTIKVNKVIFKKKKNHIKE